MRYPLLLFDLDETLLDFNHDIREAFFLMCRKQNISVDEALFSSYHAINHTWWDKFEKGLCTKPELFIGRFKEWTEKHSISANPLLLSEAIFSELSEQAKLFSGAYDLIETLHHLHTIYFATNGNAASQHKRLAVSGLNQFSEKMFVSEEAGASKPHKEYFDYVFSHIEAEKKDCLLIGDSLSSDIAGAASYGIDSMWYNPNQLINQSNFKPTYEVRSYEEILSILAV